MSVLKGDDGEKGYDKTRLNVMLEKGQLLNIFHNPKIRRHQMKF